MAVETCPLCHVRLPSEFLKTHLLRAHGTSEVSMPAPVETTAPPPTSAYRGDLATGLAPPQEPPAPVPAAERPIVEETHETVPAPPEEGTPEGPPQEASEPVTGTSAPVSQEAPVAAPSPEAGTAAPVAEGLPAIPSAAEAFPRLTTVKELRAWSQRKKHQTEHHLQDAEAWVRELEGSHHGKSSRAAKAPKKR